MDRLILAKIIDLAGGNVKTRKRLQKVIYLLKETGAPIESSFILHYYGPYSHDVARQVDEMVNLNLLTESLEPSGVSGTAYSYLLPESTKSQLDRIAKDQPEHSRLAELAPYESIAKILLEEDNLTKLEFASTVVFFHNQRNKDWDEARKAASKFKKQDDSSEIMKQAEELARQVIKS
jgi:uncharacterized protein YwgA